MIEKLFFGRGNSKLKNKEITFTLPAGFTCPTALKCLSYTNPQTGIIRDGPQTEFRCFMATTERYRGVRKNTWGNLKLLKNKSRQEMIDLIIFSLPKNFNVVRINVGGDYFSEDYFLAWREVAQKFPDRLFYCYTKRIDLLITHGQILNNHKCIASYGGKYDDLIEPNHLIWAKVCFSKAEADGLGLEIDHDDHLAKTCNKNFALLLHGTQPKGSAAGKAKIELAKTGWSGYR